ncbi:MAG: NADH-quinone oxidoreductase subunit A [bacterium]|nr:NADH-quinone oxidoreductase subunit A [bacterium]
MFCSIPDIYSSGSYLPVLLLLGLTVTFAVAMVVISRFVGRRILTKAKRTPYECGMTPVGAARERFPIKFYLIALLFVVFDIEVVFLYPWALQCKKLGLFGLVEMGIFMLLLLGGYLYILGSGALELDRGKIDDDPFGEGL